MYERFLLEKWLENNYKNITHLASDRPDLFIKNHVINNKKDFDSMNKDINISRVS